MNKDNDILQWYLGAVVIATFLAIVGLTAIVQNATAKASADKWSIPRNDYGE